jgi:Xaa-Pro aminopeptidase
MNLFDELGVDGLVVTGSTNRRYFSGWSADDHAPDRPSGVMLVLPAAAYLLASPTNLPWAAAEARPDVTPMAMTSPWTDAITSLIRQADVRRIGFEDAILPVRAFRDLEHMLGEDVDLVAASDVLDRQRQVKSPREIAFLRRALAATDQAFTASAGTLRPGMTERELADIIDDNLRRVGSEGTAFDTIVASGPNAARPHHSPGDRAIEPGEPVIIDMGAKVEGYCGDLTRTVWIGQADEQLGTMYRLVAEAQRAAIDAVRAGVAGRDIDLAARAVFAAAGKDEFFAHSVGHAVGLRIHEAPFLSQQSTDVLEAGNVVTIEPGLYLPGWGGVRIEDVVLVTDDGCENLTSAPKLLDVGETRPEPA